MKKLIKVTKKHIKEGACADPFNCPIALAIKDAFGIVTGDLVDFGNRSVSVAYNIRVNGIKYKTPRSVERFYEKFDNNKPVKPFNFYLEEIK